MINPISSTGRAFERSVNYGTRLGLSPEQATDRSSGLLLSPELQKMMQQVQYLQQQRPQMPQGTIAQQLNQLTGISALPMPEFKPRFADGGVVALAAGGPPQMTPEQIRLQQQIREAAERRMGLGSYGIGLENYPSSIEDVPEPERIVNRVVDDKGNIWHKLENGEWRQVSGKRLEGATIQNNRLVYPDRPSPMQREISSYRTGEKRLPPPDVTVDRISGNTVDRRAATSGAGGGGGEGGIRAAAAGEAGAAAEKPGWIRRGISAIAPILAGISGAETARQYGEMRRAEREAGIKSLGVDKKAPWQMRRVETMPEDWMDTPLAETAGKEPGIGPSPWEIGEAGQAFLSNLPIVGSFIQNPFETKKEAAQAKKEEQKAAAAPKPAAPKPAPAAAPTDRPAVARLGMLDIPIGIEAARAINYDAVKEADEYNKLDKQAQQEGTGPYSKMFTEGDRYVTQKLAELKDKKENSFARSLVAAGLAMAEQASKGGQPGNETQKFLAAAVAGLGGYAKAQDKLQEEKEKTQDDLAKFTMQLEQLRSGARGELRGKAYERFKDAQTMAEKARANVRALSIVQAQLEMSMAATGMKTAATMAGIQQRAQKALVDAALKDLEGDLGYQQLKLKQAQAKTPQEKAAAARDIEAAIQAQAQRIMAIPSRAAAVQYETGGAGAAGDVDFSGADDIAKMALGMTGG